MGRTSRKRHQKKKKQSNLVETDEEVLTNLKSWMLTNNCSFISHLVPYEFDITGRGLKTLKHLSANDILIRIPLEILITTNTLANSYIKRIFLKNEFYTAQCALAVFLIYETHLGFDSKWYIYLASLPKSFTNTDFCTEREKYILPSFILNYMHQCHKIKNDFTFILKSLNKLALNAQDVCPHCGMHLKEIITYSRYKWAYYTVNTRAVYLDVFPDTNSSVQIKGPNNIALAPFLDLFNHDINAKVSVSTIDMHGRQYYQLKTLKSFEKSSQVFINYGAHNSLKLYVDYGFFIPNNPLDEVQFDLHDIKMCFDIPKFKLLYLESNNLHTSMSFTREGLNHNATCTFFIINTTLAKETWNRKIYGCSLSPQELQEVYSSSKQVLNMKKECITNFIQKMGRYTQQSQSFSIGISLVKELYSILIQSLLYMSK